ncbi:hypothetical protein Bbelb_136980 [Branchiostoma belcheri]|nr:hypothetical protein Bbelb_136980 [Branchiostoma belcheri]
MLGLLSFATVADEKRTKDGRDSWGLLLKRTTGKIAPKTAQQLVVSRLYKIGCKDRAYRNNPPVNRTAARTGGEASLDRSQNGTTVLCLYKDMIRRLDNSQADSHQHLIHKTMMENSITKSVATPLCQRPCLFRDKPAPQGGRHDGKIRGDGAVYHVARGGVVSWRRAGLTCNVLPGGRASRSVRVGLDPASKGQRERQCYGVSFERKRGQRFSFTGRPRATDAAGAPVAFLPRPAPLARLSLNHLPWKTTKRTENKEKHPKHQVPRDGLTSLTAPARSRLAQIAVLPRYYRAVFTSAQSDGSPEDGARMWQVLKPAGGAAGRDAPHRAKTATLAGSAQRCLRRP